MYSCNPKTKVSNLADYQMHLGNLIIYKFLSHNPICTELKALWIRSRHPYFYCHWQMKKQGCRQFKLPLKKQKWNRTTIIRSASDKIQRSGLLVQCPFLIHSIHSIHSKNQIHLFTLGHFNAISNNSDTLSLIIHH